MRTFRTPDSPGRDLSASVTSFKVLLIGSTIVFSFLKATFSFNLSFASLPKLLMASFKDVAITPAVNLGRSKFFSNLEGSLANSYENVFEFEEVPSLMFMISRIVGDAVGPLLESTSHLRHSRDKSIES